MNHRSSAATLLIPLAPTLGCAVGSEDASSEDVASVSQAVTPGPFLYLRCNATGWNVDTATRLVQTSDPYVFELTYQVKEDWLTGGGEQCVVTKTDQDNACPDGVDYAKIIADYNVCSRVESGEISEVWLFGGPYFGYWESTMAGSCAYWVNSPPVPVACAKKFILMGFKLRARNGVDAPHNDRTHNGFQKVEVPRRLQHLRSVNGTSRRGARAPDDELGSRARLGSQLFRCGQSVIAARCALQSRRIERKVERDANASCVSKNRP